MEQAIKTLIVDDELYSRDELKHLLTGFPSIEIVGEAESGEAAMMKTIQLQPDVVFLDVEMPKMNGMKTAKALLELKKVPLVIFATAYPQFAVEAFRYNAVDYLLKPYDEDQLQETIKRIEKMLSSTNEPEIAKTKGKLAVEANGEIVYLEPKEIFYLFRDEKLTILITKNRDFETKTPLKDLELKTCYLWFFSNS